MERRGCGNQQTTVQCKALRFCMLFISCACPPCKKHPFHFESSKATKASHSNLKDLQQVSIASFLTFLHVVGCQHPMLCLLWCRTQRGMNLKALGVSFWDPTGVVSWSWSKDCILSVPKLKDKKKKQKLTSFKVTIGPPYLQIY